MTTTCIRRSGLIHCSGWFGRNIRTGKGTTLVGRSLLGSGNFVLGRPAGSVAR